MLHLKILNAKGSNKGEMEGQKSHETLKKSKMVIKNSTI